MPVTVEYRENWIKCHACSHEFMLADDETADPEGYAIVCPNCHYRWLPEGSYPPSHPKYHQFPED